MIAHLPWLIFGAAYVLAVSVVIYELAHAPLFDDEEEAV